MPPARNSAHQGTWRAGPPTGEVSWRDYGIARTTADTGHHLGHVADGVHARTPIVGLRLHEETPWEVGSGDRRQPPEEASTAVTAL